MTYEFEGFDDFEDIEPLDPEIAGKYYSDLLFALDTEPLDIVSDIEALDRVITILKPFSEDMNFTLHFEEYPWMFTTMHISDHLIKIQKTLDLGGILSKRILELSHLVGKSQEGIQRSMNEVNLLYQQIQQNGLDRYIISNITENQIMIASGVSAANEGEESVEILGKINDLYQKLRGKLSAGQD